MATLDGAERSAVQHLVGDPRLALAGFTEKQKIEIFDAAADLVDLRYAKEIVDVDRHVPANQLKQELLLRRAQISLPSEDPPSTPPWQTMPQLGAGSRRVALGAGGDTGGDRWLELRLRLAMHDLADPAIGYPELSEIEFLPTRLRWDLQAEHAEVTSIDLVHIISLTSLDRFDQHISWEARLGSERPDRSCGCLAFHVQLGGGGTVSLADQGLALFLLGEAHAWIGSIDGIRGSAFGAGLGPLLGLRARFRPNLIWLGTAEWLYRPDQGPDTRLRVGSTIRWGLVRGAALELRGDIDEDVRTLSAATLLYF